MRPTPVRLLILQVLAESRDHPSTDELFSHITRRGESTGLATVYQNLEKLVQAGLVREISGDDGLKRYDGNLQDHQHMVCEETGRIYDVQVDPKLLKSLQPLDPETGKPLKDWEISEVRVTFRVSRKNARRR
ncbi:MAG: hypothetical protein ICCCNLDF_02662 [Planctomycetes bacterium]|nr:hypothetical protein [Planctomycetota bacterium]